MIAARSQNASSFFWYSLVQTEHLRALCRKPAEHWAAAYQQRGLTPFWEHSSHDIPTLSISRSPFHTDSTLLLIVSTSRRTAAVLTAAAGQQDTCGAVQKALQACVHLWVHAEGLCLRRSSLTLMTVAAPGRSSECCSTPVRRSLRAQRLLARYGGTPALLADRTPAAQSWVHGRNRCNAGCDGHTWAAEIDRAHGFTSPLSWGLCIASLLCGSQSSQCISMDMQKGQRGCPGLERCFTCLLRAEFPCSLATCVIA